jgi:hypothetical protein
MGKSASGHERRVEHPLGTSTQPQLPDPLAGGHPFRVGPTRDTQRLGGLTVTTAYSSKGTRHCSGAFMKLLAFRKSLREDGITPVIPGRANRKKRVRHDKEGYKGPQRHRTLLLPAQGLQAYCHALRQTCQKLFFQRVPGCRTGLWM